MSADGVPDWDNFLTTTTSLPQGAADLPIAVWLCVGLGAYGIIITVILMIRQCVTAKGLCGECMFNCCDGSCGQWCVESCQASCDCKSPTVTGCLDAICPQRRNVNFADVVMCRCCLDQCECSDEGCQCGDCNCNLNYDCDNINCLCCECKLGTSDQTTQR